MSALQIFNYTALLVGYLVISSICFGIVIVCFKRLYAIAKKERNSFPPVAREPFIEDHGKGFTDNDFVDFKVKKNLEYSSN